MSHNIPLAHIQSLTKGPSPAKVTQVSDLQKYIQELLGDTHHTFLQGSYVNDTAIADINDVDIVAVRKMTYSTVHSPHKFDSSIPWEVIFTEIVIKLNAQSKYAWIVTKGDKCIKIGGAFNADVIPAVKVDHDHDEDPIVVYSRKKTEEKPNFPRTFYNNGVAKNKATGGLYKPTVRMFKNWVRNHINDDKVISSFKMQALVYSVPNETFSTDQALTFILAGIHILETLGTVNPGNGPIMSVCGYEDINQGWDPVLRATFVDRLRQSISHAISAYKAQDQATAERFWKTSFNI